MNSRSAFSDGASQTDLLVSVRWDDGRKMSDAVINAVGEREAIKQGSMKKMKTMRKKFFILLKESDGIVWLDYFDNVKKYEASSRSRSKKTVNITDSFSINQRPAYSDKNKQHAIDIFTSGNCFSLVLESESELKDWLDELRKQRTESISSLRRRKSNDENYNQDYCHLWQVTIAKKGLGLPPQNITGLYRVCLTAKMIHLYKVDPAADPETRPLEFPLNSIRKCARAGDFFSMELGRSSTIGAGELLMETDDAATARHMHETIRETMRISAESISSHAVHRPRSSSTSDGTRTRRATLGHIQSIGSSSSMQPNSSAQNTPLPQTTASSNASVAAGERTSAPTSSTSIYTTETGTANLCPASGPSFRDRCGSEPAAQTGNPRSRCTSEGISQLHYTTVSVGPNRSGSGHRINSSSPPSATLYHQHSHHHQSGALSPTSATCSTESVGSFSHSEEYSETDLAPYHAQASAKPSTLPLYSHREVSSSVPSQPSILEQDGEDSAEGYMMMDTDKASEPAYSFEDERTGDRGNNFSYVMMSPTNVSSSATSSSLLSPTTETDAYVDMSPVKAQSAENGYLSMVMGAPHPSSHAGPIDEGYLNMAPLVTALPAASASGATAGGGRVSTGKDHHNHRSRHHRSYQDSPPEPPRESLEKLAQEFPLVPVKSFFSPAEDSSDLIKPVRAYSIGSRPKQHHVLMKDQDLSQTNWYGREGEAGKAAAESSEAKGVTNEASRVRAYSMGSRTVSSGGHAAFRMNQPLRKRALTQDSIISSNSPAANVIPETSHETMSPPSNS